MVEFLGALISLLMIVAVIAGFIAYPEEIFKFSLQGIFFLIIASIVMPIAWAIIKAIFKGSVEVGCIVFKGLAKIAEAVFKPLEHLTGILDTIYSKKITSILFYVFYILFLLFILSLFK
ncbi:hypothetical protein [Campylobacter gastrosuis]|uniref:Uncharacterized protein n=1 Tax=Campylobacter gastrosuis TaxID=2974576 RepID=A0ABT7HSW9_9BACT|nr:hypothetical protein [Campylobacter gastrosuis]MDL0089995.1 hypothetical protein [Campylobacter gastrosuis]